MRKGKVRALLLTATIVASAGSFVHVSASPGTSARMTQMPGRPQPNGASPATSVPDTTSPAMSLDSKWLAFSSDATNLVVGDTNAASDIFIRTLNDDPKKQNTLVRASLTSDGKQLDGASYSPALSADGRYLAFVSTAGNVVPGHKKGSADLFYKDLKSGTVSLISSYNGQPSNGASNTPFVSLYGDYVTFESSASNLSAGDTNGFSDAFLYEVKHRRLSRVVAPAIEQDGPQTHPEITWTQHARISYDGRTLAYTRGATRTTIDRSTAMDVFIIDRSKGKTTALVVPPWAGAAKAMNDEPSMSIDGRYIAFTNWSVIDNDHTIGRNIQVGSPVQNDDSVARNPFDFKHIIMLDRFACSARTKKGVCTAYGVMTPASVRPFGSAADNDCSRPELSFNAHVIAFACDATNLVAGDTNKVADVFVNDLAQRAISRVSLSGPGGQSNGASSRPTISFDGTKIAFASAASNIDPADSNGVQDVFIRNRMDRTPNDAPEFTTTWPMTTKIVNKKPVTTADPKGVNQLEKVTLHLRAKDKDGDPLRFAALLGMPTDATLDPITGQFDWTANPNPAPNHTDANGARDDITNHSDARGGRDIYIVFWVQDPRGASAFLLAHYFVRDAATTARCQTLDHACFP